MPVVKRYPNRKLYDTEAKRYITLDGIADLIRSGHDVEVLDHTTGEDLTALTLSQVIFEQQKKHNGFLPYSVLTGLIQAGGDTLAHLRQTLSASLGLSRHVDDEIERRIESMVSRGDLTQEEGFALRERLSLEGSTSPREFWPDTQTLEQLLSERGVPSREDFQLVVDQLDLLAAKLEELMQSD
jgi:polyhydroxyalkanoate synthesis repressor PhaR